MITTENINWFPVLLVLPGKNERIEQVIKSYQVPEARDRAVVYDEIMGKIEEGSKHQIRGKVNRIKTAYRISVSMAASLVLIFLLHFLLSVKTFESTSDQIATLRLPDHSRIVLSQKSTASYPKYWWKREVNDTAGDMIFAQQVSGYGKCKRIDHQLLRRTG